MSMSRARKFIVLSLALLLCLTALAPAAAAQTPGSSDPERSLAAWSGLPPVGEWVHRLLAWLGLSRPAGAGAAGVTAPVLAPGEPDPVPPPQERYLLLPPDPRPLVPTQASAQPAATPSRPAAAQPSHRADLPAPARSLDLTRPAGRQAAPEQQSAPPPAIRLTPAALPRVGPKPPSACPDRACPDDSTGCSPCPPAPPRLPTAVR
jgi:hypothetical protein